MTYSEAISEMKSGKQVRRAVWHFACRSILVHGEICQKINGLVAAPDNIDKFALDWHLTSLPSRQT